MFLYCMILSIIHFVAGQETMVTFGRYDYIINHEPFAYNAANDECEMKNAKLAVIYNETVFQILRNAVQTSPNISNSYWIGLRRIPGTDRFNWSDGTPLLQDSFQTWSGSEPDNLGDSEDCVTMGNPCCNGRFSMYRWSDYSCLAPGQTIKPGFICQKLAANYSIPEPTSTPSATSTKSTTPTTNVVLTTRAENNTENRLPQISLPIVISIVVVALLVIIALIFIMVCYRKKLFQSSKKQAQRANGNGNLKGQHEAATYEAVSPEINETNFYEIPQHGDSSNKKGNEVRASYFSQFSQDSFDDDLAPSEEHDGQNREIEEGAYCSVGEFHVEPGQEEYVPFSVLETKEDCTYSIPQPLKPTFPPEQDTYDALTCPT